METLVTAALMLTVWFDGVPVRCLADTGAAYTVMTEAQASRVGTWWPGRSSQSIMTMNGAIVPAEARAVSHVGTDRLGWSHARVMVISDTNSHHLDLCILGSDLLMQHGPLVFDFSKQTVYPLPIMV